MNITRDVSDSKYFFFNDKEQWFLLSFYGLILAPAAATTPVSQKWRDTEV